mmetsp:Transcript_97843/g.169451  ORF Transcript_97843/g.169451 Transcript_97843/m.169451 type:complete len:121 (+) Transcript_97843:88-450(+)
MVKGKAFRKQWKEARKPLQKRSSSKLKSLHRDTYQQRQEKKRALDEVKQKSKELLEARTEVRKSKAKKRMEKKKRKEENEIRSGQYQVIKKTENIRKWHKNAKKQLKMMGPDQIDRLLGR